MTVPSPIPMPSAALASAGRALAAEFPCWQIGVIPGALSMWAAYWQSADGRHRRLIVAPSSPELLARLRAAAASKSSSETASASS
jgi:hypothetical protein